MQPVSIGPVITKMGTDGLPLARGIAQARRDAATVIWFHNHWGLERIANLVTGRLDGPNCRGPEKLRRLHEWLRGEELSDRAEIWAYGDSAGDRELLAGASRSFFVRNVVVPSIPDGAHP